MGPKNKPTVEEFRMVGRKPKERKTMDPWKHAELVEKMLNGS